MIENHGTPFSVPASGGSTTSAYYSGTTNQLLYVTDISASSSGTMGTWYLYLDQGTTVLWAGSGTVNYRFSEPIRVTKGHGVSLFANGTTATFANISGFYIAVA